MSDNMNDGGRVFPGPSYTQSGHHNGHEMGLTLRDAAGLAALQGLCAAPNVDAPPDVIAAASWRMADAFIAARDGKP